MLAPLPGGGLFYKHDFYFLRHVLKIVDSFRIVKPTNVSKPLRQLADWGAKTVTQPKNPNYINTKSLIYNVLI
jgi:hypothetical protein